jgi:hypothetical protein
VIVDSVEVRMPEMQPAQPAHPGLMLQTPFTRHKLRRVADERVAAGASYVTEWLRRQYGEASDPEPRGEYKVWSVAPLTTQRFSICVAELALAQSYFQLGGWLGLIAEDARENAPSSPACYHLGQHGVLGVRGMNSVEFEAFGQVVRCERHATDAGSNWSLSVDGIPKGQPFPASPDDLRDDVAQRALLLLCDRRLIRVPESPWQWSVIGDLGREWWVRLSVGDPGMHSGRQLVMRDTVSGLEERMPWPDDVAPPRAGQLRRFVGG